MVKMSRVGYYLGEYRHNLTAQNRLALPKRFRFEIEGTEIVVARGDGNWIEGFAVEKWKQVVQQFLTVPFTEAEGRNLRRRVFASAMLVELDAQGRIVIPDPLLTWAGLKGKVGEELVVLGVGDHFEIWEKNQFEAQEVRKS